MDTVWQRIKGVGAPVWVLLVLAAVLTYGAKKIIQLLGLPEEREQRYLIIFKAVGMACAVADCVLVLLN